MEIFIGEIEKWTNKGNDKQEEADSLFKYTVQQVIPNICTKFQNPRFSSSREIFDKKKSLHTRTHTNTDQHCYGKDKNYKPPIDFV